MNELIERYIYEWHMNVRNKITNRCINELVCIRMCKHLNECVSVETNEWV